MEECKGKIWEIPEKLGIMADTRNWINYQRADKECNSVKDSLLESLEFQGK